MGTYPAWWYSPRVMIFCIRQIVTLIPLLALFLLLDLLLQQSSYLYQAAPVSSASLSFTKRWLRGIFIGRSSTQSTCLWLVGFWGFSFYIALDGCDLHSSFRCATSLTGFASGVLLTDLGLFVRFVLPHFFCCPVVQSTLFSRPYTLSRAFASFSGTPALTIFQ